MADSILRLRVESQEYDNKLKRAAEGIRHLADVAHQGGGELTGLEKAEVEFIRSLGEMETKSRTAAGSARELENAFKELTVIYNNLNDVEKADEGGKALAASLEQIKQRAQEARAQLDNASKSLSDNGQEAKDSSGALDALASKFTINIDALKLFDMGLKAAGVALDVAKDAFFASEATVDEWGRIVDSSRSLYEGFLTALNTGDISGYLSRIDSIVQAARTAYNELDRLGTMKTIQAPQMSAQQTENERMRMMIQTGRYIAPIDGRRNAVFNGREMQSGDKLTAGQIRALEKQLQNGMQKVVTLVGNEVKQTSKAIDAVYNRQAKELGMDLSEFRKGTSSMAEFDKRMAGYDQYQKWRNENYYTDNWGNRRVKEGNPFEEYKKWGTFRVDGERYNDLVRLIQQRDQQAGQAYGMQSQAYRAMNRAEGFTVSKLMNGGNGGKGGKTITEEKDDFKEVEEIVGLLNLQKQKLDDLQAMKPFAATEEEIVRLNKEIEKANTEYQRLLNLGKEKPIEIATGTSIQNNAGMSAYIASIKQQLETADYGTSLYNGLSAQLADMTTLQNLVGESLKAGLGTAMFDAADATGKDFWTRAMEGGVDNIDWQTIVDKINEARKAAGLDAIAINFKTGDVKNQAKEMTEDWKGAASAIQSVGSAMQQIEDPAAKVMGTIAQAIATIALTFAKSLEKTFTPWDWIAAAAAGTATMISTISAIHSATGYAEGGMIKGNSYSGDNLMAIGPNGSLIGLDAGEIVLNKSQQATLAQNLQGSGLSALNLTATIKGEQIRLALNNNGRRTGRGEYVQSRNVR